MRNGLGVPRCYLDSGSGCPINVSPVSIKMFNVPVTPDDHQT